MSQDITVFMIRGDKATVLATIDSIVEGKEVKAQTYTPVSTSATTYAPATVQPTLNFKTSSVSRYDGYTFVLDDKRLNSRQKIIADRYTKNKRELSFNDLKDFIYSSNCSNPSNIAISNYLRDSGYDRFRDYDSRTLKTRAVWSKK